MTTETSYKTSSAEVIRQTDNRIINIVEILNPEIALVSILQRYLARLEFSDIYEHFGNVRVSTVHPFALLLAAEVLNTPEPVHLFPSITIADSSENEEDSTLSRNRKDYMLERADLERLITARDEGKLLISDANITALRNAEYRYAVHHTYISQHTINMNIWADNKEVTSDLYDLVKLCIVDNMGELRGRGISVNGKISGQRTGDVNLDFGQILFGANVSVPVSIQTGVMNVDITIRTLVDGTIDPNYHILEES